MPTQNKTAETAQSVVDFIHSWVDKEEKKQDSFRLIELLLLQLRYTSILLLIFPFWAYGQLFPVVPSETGNIKKISERRYGKWKYKNGTPTYSPSHYSGWKYIHWFDEAGVVIRRKHLYKGKIRSDIIYEYDTTAVNITHREIIKANVNGHKGEWTERIYALGEHGQINELRIWSFSSDTSKKLVALEDMIRRDPLNRMISFTRSIPPLSKDPVERYEYTLFYDQNLKIFQIDENYLEHKLKIAPSAEIPGASTVIHIPITSPEPSKRWTFTYNADGLLIESEMSYLDQSDTSIHHGSDPVIHTYEYDDHGNWIKMYRRTDDTKVIVVEREIEYRSDKEFDDSEEH